MKVRLLIIFVGVVVGGEVFGAVPYDYKPKKRVGVKPAPTHYIRRLKPAAIKQYDYFGEFVEIADFLTLWQVTNPSDTNFGGMIEAEAGPLGDAVQTDNTLEAIWVWSRYAELTGDTAKHGENIKNAWVYCDSFPAWEEEGGSEDYYRVHNCAWALVACLTYCETYGDSARYWYSDTCANYIISHPLDIYSTSPIWGVLNPFVTGWAAGNLYHYGKVWGDSIWVDTALAYGMRLRNWATTPSRLRDEFWAMSSGTVVWGMCNSFFQEDTAEGLNWIASCGGWVDTLQPWYDRQYDYYDWDNAWNVAFCNGHYAMYEICHDPKYLRHHKFLTELLLSYDTDLDGGIQATTQDPDTEDMTWISSYLCFKGLDKLIGIPDTDAGVWSFVSPQDGDEFYIGDTIELSIKISNFGLSDIDELKVEVAGDYEDSLIDSLDFGEAKEITFTNEWILPLNPDTLNLTAFTVCEGDTNPENDTISIIFYVIPYGVAEKDYAKKELFTARPNPFTGETKILFCVPSDSVPEVKIYNVLGELVRAFEADEIKATGHLYKIAWKGENNYKRRLPAGIYFLRMRSPGYSRTSKLILLK